MARTVLVIIPHPDDELFFGGALALAADAGAAVHLLALTRGDAGQDRAFGLPPGPLLAARRTEELTLACARLGIGAPRFCDWPDGGVALVDPDVAAASLGAALDDLRPDVVLTFGPDGAYGHADHVAAAALVTTAVNDRDRPPRLLRSAFPRDLFTPLKEALLRRTLRRILADPPPAVLGIDRAAAAVIVDVRAVAERKLSALTAHRTQLPGGDPRAFLWPGLVDALLAEEWYTCDAGPPPPPGATDLFAGLAG